MLCYLGRNGIWNRGVMMGSWLSAPIPFGIYCPSVGMAVVSYWVKEHIFSLQIIGMISMWFYSIFFCLPMIRTLNCFQWREIHTRRRRSTRMTTTTEVGVMQRKVFLSDCIALRKRDWYFEERVQHNVLTHFGALLHSTRYRRTVINVQNLLPWWKVLKSLFKSSHPSRLK